MIWASLAWTTRTLPENELFLTPTNSTRCEDESIHSPSTVPTGSPLSSMTLHPVSFRAPASSRESNRIVFISSASHFHSSPQPPPVDLSCLARPPFYPMNAGTLWSIVALDKLSEQPSPEVFYLSYLVPSKLVLAFC